VATPKPHGLARLLTPDIPHYRPLTYSYSTCTARPISFDSSEVWSRTMSAGPLAREKF